MDSSFVQKLLGVPEFRNWATWPRLRPLRGCFIFFTLDRSVLHLCTKFEAHCSICSNVINGSQDLEIKSRDPGHAHLGVVLWSSHSESVLLCMYQMWSG